MTQSGGRLPDGQIQPAARPVSTTIRPQQRQAKEPAKPWSLPEGPGVRTAQAGGASSFSTNPMQTFAESLSRFNGNLSKVAGNLAQGYVAGQVAMGEREASTFYLRNELTAAGLQLQERIEREGAEYQDEVRDLRRVNPTAAQFLSDANPYRLAGRRRVAAQRAGQDISNALNTGYTRDRSALIALPEGSGELTTWKASQVQTVLTAYGLTEDYPEVSKYVLPQLNRAWDKVTERHSKDRQAVIDEDAGTFASASMAGVLRQAALAGDVTIQDPNTGQTAVLKAGSQPWVEMYQRHLTELNDQAIRQVDPAKRGAWMDERFKQLKSQLGISEGDPLYQVIAGIRIGDPNVPYEKRPRLGEARQTEMRDAQVRNLELERNELRWQREQQQLQQIDLEAAATADWYQTVAPLIGQGEPFAVARAEWMQRNSGLGAGLPELAIKLNKAGTEFNQAAADPKVFGEFLGSIPRIPQAEWNPEQARRQGLELIQRSGGTAEQQGAAVAQLNREIESKNKLVEKRGEGALRTTGNAIKTDLEQFFPEGMKKLAKRISGLGGDYGRLGSVVRAFGDARMNYASEQLTKLYEASLDRVYGEWEQKYPGSPITPAQQAQLNADAVYRVRQSEDYKELFKEQSTALDPGQKPKPVTTPVVPLSRVRSLPDADLRQFRSKPLVSGESLRQTINYSLQNDGKAGPDLAAAAKKAGVSPLVFMREQLKFYGALDRSGDVRRWLDQRIKQEGKGQRAAAQSTQDVAQQQPAPPAPQLPPPTPEGGVGGPVPGAGVVRTPMALPVVRAQVEGNPYAGGGGGVVDPDVYAPGNWVYNMINGRDGGRIAARILGFSGVPTARPSLMDGIRLGAPAQVVIPQGGAPASTAPFEGVLSMLRAGEGSWDSANRGNAGDTPGGVPGLSRMTLGQWRELQSTGWNALGAYQFTKPALALAARELGLSNATVMAPAVQDRLAVQLMLGSKRPTLARYLRGQSNDLDKAADDLALEWASVATRSGGTAYPNVGRNASSISRSNAKQALRKAREAYLSSRQTATGSPVIQNGLESISRPRGVRPSEITSRFNSKESFRKHHHEGVDVGLNQGTPLGLSVGGTVIGVYRTSSSNTGANGGYGGYLDVKLSNGNVVRLAHLSRIPQQIRKGMQFSPNQVLAFSGGQKGTAGAGRSTGAHLHMELLSRPMGQEETTRGKLDPERNGALSLLRLGG